MITPVSEKLISIEAADRLIQAHDAEAAMLYLYYSRRGCTDAESACLDLSRTMSEIKASEEKLTRMGLLPLGEKIAPSPVVKPNPVILPADPVGDDQPTITAFDVEATTKRDEHFAEILKEAQNLIGQHLSSGDMKTLLNIYSNLAIPYDVMLMLMNYCAESNRIRYKGRRRLSTRYIELEALYWANREIVTVEQADEYIRRAEFKRDSTDRIATSLGILDRPLTKSVNEYISRWLDWGFTDQEIGMANDRSMAKTGKLSLSYINGILDRWQKNGLLTARDIEEKDPFHSGAKKNIEAPARTKTSSEAVDIDRLRSLMDKI